MFFGNNSFSHDSHGLAIKNNDLILCREIGTHGAPEPYIVIYIKHCYEPLHCIPACKKSISHVLLYVVQTGWFFPRLIKKQSSNLKKQIMYGKANLPETCLDRSSSEHPDRHWRSARFTLNTVGNPHSSVQPRNSTQRKQGFFSKS